MIKIIDWISRITAVILAIGSSLFAILSLIMKLSTKAGVIDAGMRNIAVMGIGILILTIFSSSLQLGLFLTPWVRQRDIKCRLGVAMLMLPSSSIFLNIVTNITKTKILKELPLNIGETILFIVGSIGSIIYIIQYYLLFKSKKADITSQHTYTSHLKHDVIFNPPNMENLKEPLFILKYSWWKVCAGIFGGMVGGVGLLGTIVYLAISTSWAVKIGLLLGVMLIVAVWIWGTIEVVLFKDVKLYGNRIVKSWYLLGQKEVKLEKAYISKSRDFLFIPGLTVKIYLRKSRFGLKEGVSFVEDIAKQKDIKEFYSTLAELSGRNAKDLSGGKVKSFKYHIWTKKLIKEGNNNENINNFK